MKKTTIVTLALGLLAFQTIASAEVIYGYVQKVDPASNTIMIDRLDTAKNKNQNLPEQLQLKVSRDAKLKNIAAITDLKKDNAVKVDAKQNADLGIWEANSVELNNEATANQ